MEDYFRIMDNYLKVIFYVIIPFTFLSISISIFIFIVIFLYQVAIFIIVLNICLVTIINHKVLLILIKVSRNVLS